MSERTSPPRRVLDGRAGALRALAASGALLGASAAVVLVLGATLAGAAGAPVGLGTAASFGVLAGSTVTNTGPSVLTGSDLGLSPGTAVTGFPPGQLVGGTIHAADAVADQAQTDLTQAYVDAASRPATALVTSDLGGQALTPGVYSGASLGLTGTLTLDGGNDPNALFVFQSASTLTTASSSVVALTGGAQWCNVFWQVGSSATLGTDSVFVGTTMALTSITALTNASVNGRLLARNGAVTLDSNLLTRTACTSVPPVTTSSSTTSSSSSTSTTSAPSSSSSTSTTSAPTTSSSTSTTSAPTTSSSTSTTSAPTTSSSTSTTSASTTSGAPGGGPGGTLVHAVRVDVRSDAGLPPAGSAPGPGAPARTDTTSAGLPHSGANPRGPLLAGAGALSLGVLLLLGAAAMRRRATSRA